MSYVRCSIQLVLKAWRKWCIKCKMKCSLFNPDAPRLRKCSSRLYTGTLKCYPLQRSNFRRLKINLKLTWRPFAIGAVFKTPQPNREMRAAMPRAGRRPAGWQTQNLAWKACFLPSKLFRRLFQVRTVTFSCDSSWKWLFVCLGGENLEKRWQGAPSCWRMLESVSEHHSLE